MRNYLMFISFVVISSMCMGQDILKTSQLIAKCPLLENNTTPKTIILYMRKGENVDVISSENGFYKVRYKNRIGYINDVFIYDTELMKIIDENRIKEEKERASALAEAEESRLKKQAEIYKKEREEDAKKVQAIIDAEQRKKELREKYLVERFGKDKASIIILKQVRIGMTKDEAEASWGFPSKINTTKTANHIHEQWVYDTDNYSSKYLYFENGILTTIQE